MAASRSKGAAYVTALLLLVLVGGLGAGLLAVGRLERRVERSVREHDLAREAAHSAIAVGISELLAGGEPAEREARIPSRIRRGALAEVLLTVAAPTLVATRRCRSCVEAGGAVDYLLQARGEWRLRAEDAPIEGPARAVHRIDAVVTLQPWAVPGGSRSAAAGALCTPEAAGRVRKLLQQELHPRSCRLSPPVWRLTGRDAVSEAVCEVWLETCVLLSGWWEGV